MLPAGCYSDDTQLRLATARAITGNGFDVEAFAQVELTVWPTYAIGGGNSSKAAAAHMGKQSTPWFGNFYSGWLDAGGNGVAMRIQPHVWAAREPGTLGGHIRDTIMNGAATHGHPRALVGAVLHALALGAAMSGRIPSAQEWPELLDATEQAVKLIDDHPQLASFWRPVWERQAQADLTSAWRVTVNECRQMLPAAAAASEQLSRTDLQSNAAREAYDQLAEALCLREPARRGSGTGTVMAALALAAAAPGNPANAARLAAQAVGTDTDTIATMAAAIIGAADTVPPPPASHVLDAPYLTAEAIRLADIASGQPARAFTYPDLLHWSPPRTQLDAVGTAGQHIALAGIGWLEHMENTDLVFVSQGTEYAWKRSDFGPSFLVKQRQQLRALPEGNWPPRHDYLALHKIGAAMKLEDEGQAELFGPQDHYGFGGDLSSYGPSPSRPDLYVQVKMTHDEPAGDRQEAQYIPARYSIPVSDESIAGQGSLSIDQMLIWLARRGYADEAIGYAIKRIAELGTFEQFVAFCTTIRVDLRRRDGGHLPHRDQAGDLS
jgi:ADP-ribosylglycohydrolase